MRDNIWNSFDAGHAMSGTPPVLILRRILSKVGIDHPDGRSLYALPITAEEHNELEKLLRSWFASRPIPSSTAAAFVLWSAEHIRSQFKGGQLTWDFVFQGLELSGGHTRGRELVEDGLRWWKRKVRISEAGIHLYLYTLMAEGGLPQALLMQQGLYSRVVKGLLADVEIEGPAVPDEWAFRIASRRIADLPQTFQTDDIARLLADLAIKLIRLRAEPPQDVPPELIDRWLDKHQPDWVKSLPLRLSQEAAETLIRSALRSERKTVTASQPLASRSLLWDESRGKWRCIVRLAAEGFLASEMLPSAKGLRLRFLPVGLAAERGGAVIYSASPDDNGWELRRIGGSGAIPLPFDLDAPLIFAGFADGRLIGEVEIAPAIPLPDEEPTLWKAVEQSQNGDLPVELVPLAQTARTRAPKIWLLTSALETPVASEGIALGTKQSSSSGCLWPVSGAGHICLGERRWHIETGAETGAAEDVPETRLMAHGKILPEWRLAGNGGHVFLGKPVLYGQRGTGSLERLPRAKIRMRPARLLMGEIAELLEMDSAVARLRYVTFPENTVITLQETSAGILALDVQGLPSGLSLTLEAGQAKERMRLSDGGGRLTLSVKGAPPGIVTLHLSSPEEGRSLSIVCPWPAMSGMILRPENSRLECDTPIAVDALRGWRAIVPKNLRSEIQLRQRDLCVAMRVEGETPLAAHIPLIRAMLAHGGPDSEVRLSLITAGQEGRRLEIRRYHSQSSVVRNGSLRLGLLRGTRSVQETVFSLLATRGTVLLHAVDLNAPDRVERHEIESKGDIDLRSRLPAGDTLWLIQASLNGEVQRATVWSPKPMPSSSREERIRGFASTWTELADSTERSRWSQQWTLIQAAAAGGDAGVLDQVQALAHVPQAALRLLFRVPGHELAQALALDTAAPIFWPIFPVTAFQSALTTELACLTLQYEEVLDDRQEARKDATTALARRVSGILSLHPELAGHFVAALAQTELIQEMPQDLLEKIVVLPSVERLAEIAQEAARRVDWLPTGVRGIEAHHRPPNFPFFNPHITKLIDAPLVTAEIAVGLRPSPETPSAMLTLVNLRLIDPDYFDKALPFALALAWQKAHP